MFLDLNEENVIDVSEIVKGNLIGRGAFGFVFKAVLNKRSAVDGPKSVAMKMLQPVQPGIRTGKVILKYHRLSITIVNLTQKNFLCSISERTNGIQSGFRKMAS